MIKWLTSLTRLIVGRVKRMISNIILQYGAVSIPLGITMFIFSTLFSEGWKMYVGWVLSILMFALGTFAFSEAMKTARKEQKSSDDRFDALINEVRGLRQDMINGGRNDDKYTGKTNA